MYNIEIELEKRILILDGAMGTMIQTYGLQEKDFRDQRHQSHPISLKGNNDLLNITTPDIIKEIHTKYLEAGADIIVTNTLNANKISQKEYETEHLVSEINICGANIARDAVNEISSRNSTRSIFIAGSMGPTNKLASFPTDINNPGFRSVSFDQLVEAYTEQAKALIEGGVDLLLLETITDTLNAKAALFALIQLFDVLQKEYPIMVSVTISDVSGRILSGQTLEAFLISISHAPILSVGLNCSLGAKELKPFMKLLDEVSPFFLSIHPNAGLPNQFGEYDQSAEEFCKIIEEYGSNGWLNIVGGCCGTTPEHIKAISKSLTKISPRPFRKYAFTKHL
jgi:5-methyltetrahydrofolate--homocysteine methyltransferase